MPLARKAVSLALRCSMSEFVSSIRVGGVNQKTAGSARKTFGDDSTLFDSAAGLPIVLRMADKHYRSLIKAVSWRLTGSVDTLIISFLITGKLKWALTISGVELFTKIGLYYVHERVWDTLSFGRVKPSAKGKVNFEI
jgi:uncharacterized membrane protein